jgi:hypothetical protein
MMEGYESEDAFGGDGVGVAFRDMLIVGVVAITTVMLILLAAVSDPKKAVEDPNLAVTNPGNIIFEAYWNVFDPETKDLIATDVDLWVQYRGRSEDEREAPVSYSNKGSNTLNYLRDDLGCVYQALDPASACIPFKDEANYEMTVTRGLPTGKYCASVQLYNNKSSLKVIPVKFKIRIQKGAVGSAENKEPPKKVLDTEVKLEWTGQEVPVQCFTLSDKGDVVSQSNSNAECLRLKYDPMLNRCRS